MDNKILIVSELFYPANRIGALRPSKLAKYLLMRGYKVDVITREKPEGFYLHPNCRFFTIQDDVVFTNVVENRTTFSATDRKSMSGALLTNPLVNELRRLKRILCSLSDAIKYKKKVDALFTCQSIVPAEYRACITSYGPLSSVLIGLSLKRHHKVRKWICDFRDPIVVEDSSRIMKPFLLFLQNRCLQHADRVITVSAGCVKMILKGSKRRNITVIPNGYDSEDTTDLFSSLQHSKSNVISCTYAGSLYEGKGKIRPFFMALSSLIESRQIDANKIIFHYAGYEGHIAIEEARNFGLSEIICDHGFLRRDDCLRLQMQSDLLLLTTWNTRTSKGVLTGKFFEYLQIGKPICAIVTGECAGSETAAIITEGNLGVAYEEANHIRDFQKLKNYLLALYSSHINDDPVIFHPKPEVVERYNYRNLINLYVKVIED